MKFLVIINYYSGLIKQFNITANSVLGADKLMRTKHSGLLVGAERMSVETI